MTRNEQAEFINVLVENVRQQMLSKLNKAPYEWDGVELRWFIQHNFNLIVWGDMENKRTGRYRRFVKELQNL